MDALVLEHLDHVDVDEIDAELLAGDTMALHLADDGVGELVDLGDGAGTGGTFDPGIGPADVLLWQPGRMTLDLEAQVALLEQNRAAVAAQKRIAQARLEAVPARRQRTGNIPAIFVVHAQERAQA